MNYLFFNKYNFLFFFVIFFGSHTFSQTEEDLFLGLIEKARVYRYENFESGKLDSAAFYYQRLIEEEDRVSNWEKKLLFCCISKKPMSQLILSLS